MAEKFPVTHYTVNFVRGQYSVQVTWEKFSWDHLLVIHPVLYGNFSHGTCRVLSLTIRKGWRTGTVLEYSTVNARSKSI